ncbi:uncharacterized protein PGTG_03075 [Puccinia graminis f. sp. tritici CRL 75-36-700-3]|uniref:Uncharacterized protein n=1 Tax=Puccinia graminis f. sp. tritici (strain CRL 75-36-700-3 / race SCCL) TaxID=418459 RepID=E3JYJ4_PUCGT|nr:uncharacterized protein PGTG_03075 [Puccinia graminis f. sp. tritici CRL 75-36-700-3]EFP77119.2 hypothetical protein PGTG_03075 [Puccinia graminis f. sp. tritici CRL 75-36-700-3]
MRVIQQANVDNFDALLANPSAITKDPNLLKMTRKRNKTTPKGTLSYPSAVAQDLVHHLVHSFEVFYGELLGPQAKFPAAAFFGVEQATIIVGSMDQICSRGSQNMGLMGVQCFPGQLESLNNAIIQWMASKVYLSHLLQTANLTRFIKSEGLQVQEAMAAKPAALQSQAKARRQAKKNCQSSGQGPRGFKTKQDTYHLCVSGRPSNILAGLRTYRNSLDGYRQYPTAPPLCHLPPGGSLRNHQKLDAATKRALHD